MNGPLGAAAALALLLSVLFVVAVSLWLMWNFPLVMAALVIAGIVASVAWRGWTGAFWE